MTGAGGFAMQSGDAPRKAKLSKGTFERSENPKGAQAGARAKSVKTQCRAMSKMPSAALVWAASGTQHFQMRRFAMDSMARLI